MAWLILVVDCSIVEWSLNSARTAMKISSRRNAIESIVFCVAMTVLACTIWVEGAVGKAGAAGKPRCPYPAPPSAGGGARTGPWLRG